MAKKQRPRLPSVQRSLAWLAGVLVAERRGGLHRHPSEAPEDAELIETHMSFAQLGEDAGRDPVLRPLVRALADGIAHAHCQAAFARDVLDRVGIGRHRGTPMAFLVAPLVGAAVERLALPEGPDAVRAALVIARAHTGDRGRFLGNAAAPKAVADLRTALEHLVARIPEVPCYGPVWDAVLDLTLRGDAPLREIVETERTLDAAGVADVDPEFPALGLSVSGRLSVALGQGGAIMLLGLGEDGRDDGGAGDAPF